MALKNAREVCVGKFFKDNLRKRPESQKIWFPRRLCSYPRAFVWYHPFGKNLFRTEINKVPSAGYQVPNKAPNPYWPCSRPHNFLYRWDFSAKSAPKERSWGGGWGQALRFRTSFHCNRRNFFVFSNQKMEKTRFSIAVVERFLIFGCTNEKYSSRASRTYVGWYVALMCAEL